MPADARALWFLVVIAIVVAIEMMPAIVPTKGLGAKIRVARAHVRLLRDTALAFRAAHSRWPTEEELYKAMHVPIGLMKDPWGNDYLVRMGNGAGQFVVVSTGPDGVEGTVDDVLADR